MAQQQGINGGPTGDIMSHVTQGGVDGAIIQESLGVWDIVWDYHWTQHGRLLSFSPKKRGYQWPTTVRFFF